MRFNTLNSVFAAFNEILSFPRVRPPDCNTCLRESKKMTEESRFLWPSNRSWLNSFTIMFRIREHSKFKGGCIDHAHSNDGWLDRIMIKDAFTHQSWGLTGTEMQQGGTTPRWFGGYNSHSFAAESSSEDGGVQSCDCAALFYMLTVNVNYLFFHQPFHVIITSRLSDDNIPWLLFFFSR